MSSNGSNTKASAGATATRRFAALAALAALAVSLTLVIMTSAQGQQIDLQVDCDAQSQHDENCSQDFETAPEPAPEPQPEPKPAPPEPSSGETHSYDLRSGQGTVKTDDGDVQEETLDLDLNEPAQEQAAEDEEDGAKDDAKGKPLVAQDIGLSSVSTNGGGAFAGFGADFLSGDEAVSRFAVPPFLIPIYVAAGRAYDVPWNVLAAINQIETDFGRIRSQVSYAGARGWMQFMPGTWRMYGVDASGVVRDEPVALARRDRGLAREEEHALLQPYRV